MFQASPTSHLRLSMWLSISCWRLQPANAYAIDFLLEGAPKTWYYVLPQDRQTFEALAKRLFSKEVSLCSDFVKQHASCMISPEVLEENGVSFETVVQNPGECLVIGPSTYHFSFSHGFNVSELRYFVTATWAASDAPESLTCSCGLTDRETYRFDVEEVLGRISSSALLAWRAQRDKSTPSNDHIQGNNPEIPLLDFMTLDGRSLKFSVQGRRLLQEHGQTIEEAEKNHLQAWSEQQRYVINHFKHFSMSDLRTKVNPITGECIEGRGELDRLSKALNFCNPVCSFHDLVNSGEMFLFDRELNLPQESPKKNNEGIVTKGEKKMAMMDVNAFLFKHVVMDDIEACLHPKTGELLQEHGASDMFDLLSMQELINAGIMYRAGRKKVSAMLPLPPRRTLHLVLLRSTKLPMVKVLVTATSQRTVGKVPSLVQALLDRGAKPSELVRSGELEVVSRVRKRRKNFSNARDDFETRVVQGKAAELGQEISQTWTIESDAGNRVALAALFTPGKTVFSYPSGPHGSELSKGLIELTFDECVSLFSLTKCDKRANDPSMITAWKMVRALGEYHLRFDFWEELDFCDGSGIVRTNLRSKKLQAQYLKQFGHILGDMSLEKLVKKGILHNSRKVKAQLHKECQRQIAAMLGCSDTDLCVDIVENASETSVTIKDIDSRCYIVREKNDRPKKSFPPSKVTAEHEAENEIKISNEEFVAALETENSFNGEREKDMFVEFPPSNGPNGLPQPVSDEETTSDDSDPEMDWWPSEEEEHEDVASTNGVNNAKG